MSSITDRFPVLRRITASWEPDAEGLPNRRVLFAPLIALAVILLGLVAGGITGSSSGMLNASFNSSADPNLIAGTPQAIRSDEWSVNTSWVISQVEQGLPIENRNFPGGTDVTVLQDLPSSDWSTAFRPHLLGFAILPVDNGMALKWWLPPLALIGATYFFAVTLLPRRPVTSGLLAVGFFFSPFLQWWFGANTFWPAAWAFLLMGAAVWLLRTRRRLPRIILPVLVGYLAVTVGMTVYIPFILPVTVVAAAFCVGFVLTRGSADGTIQTRLRALRGILFAGVAAALVLGIWILTRLQTIGGFTSTVYPGARSEPTGEAGFQGLLAFFGAPFSRGLGPAQGLPLGPNASEASTFIVAGLFLIVPLLWMLIERIRRGGGIDWVVLLPIALGAVLAAFLFVPGWDAVAQLLRLDLVPNERMRFAFGILSVLLIVLTVLRIDERVRDGLRRPPLWTVLLAGALSLLAYGVVALDLVPQHTPLTASKVWVVAVLALSAAVVLIALRAPALGTAAILAVGMVVAGSVNPVYVGVYDLNGTTLVKTMQQIDAEDPGFWVGAGNTPLLGITLVQSGLASYNGIQGAPSEEMWKQIDPSGEREDAWNRLANISWGVGDGPPDPFNPTEDQIRMIFDSCYSFAQDNVSYVLSEFDIQQPCVERLDTIRQGPSTFFIYRVVPRP
ncbi:MAG TPA: hypothetical protein VNJ54_19970 [Plantibacter sp.]|uniref:DUF7657 domain-containing protein n=1 Tax=unclassified Plantibacter TaxID=2624265 RepID=UPI002CBB827F|nr:hypothetical protein [Plantibacter sp.]